jgi:hypothetical protein
MRLSLGNLLHNTTIPKYQDTRSMSIQRNGYVLFVPKFLPDNVKESIKRIEHGKTPTEAGKDLLVLRFILLSKIKTNTITPDLADSFDPQIITLKPRISEDLDSMGF